MNPYDLIKAERQKQIAKGYDAKHDDEHIGGELADAAAAYAASEGVNNCGDNAIRMWPFGGRPWENRKAMENLATAGALIVAEMERWARRYPNAAAAAIAAPPPALSDEGRATVERLKERFSSPPPATELGKMLDGAYAATAAIAHDPELARQLAAEVIADHAKAVSPPPLTGAWPRTREELAAERAQAADHARRDELDRRRRTAAAPPPPSDDYFIFEPVGRGAFHSGRQQYRVICRRCGDVVHDQTTGPETRADEHARICTAVGPAVKPLYLFRVTSPNGDEYLVSAFGPDYVAAAIRDNNKVDDWAPADEDEFHIYAYANSEVPEWPGLKRLASEWAAEGRGVVSAVMIPTVVVESVAAKPTGPEIDWKLSRQALGRGIKSAPSVKIGDMVGTDAAKAGAESAAIERAAETLISIGKEKPDGEVEIRVHKARPPFGLVIEYATVAIERNIRAARALLMPAGKRGELGRMMAEASERRWGEAERLAAGTEQLLRLLTDLVDAVEHAEFDTALEEHPWDRENVRQKLDAAKKLLGLP